jgi:Protein of unknown function (DUF2934)
MATTASTSSPRKAVKAMPVHPAVKPSIKPKAAGKKLIETPSASKLIKPKATSKSAATKPAHEKMGVAKKTVAKKVAPKVERGKAVPEKPAPKRAISRAAAKPQSRGNGMTAEERHRMICDAAYFRAERRGFANGDPQQDWLEAEQEIEDLRL